MLQIFRERIQGLFAKIIIIIIISSFALWGIGNYLIANQANNAVAKINGKEVPSSKVRVAYERLLRRADLNQIDTEALKIQARESVIAEQLYLNEAKRLGLVASNDQVRNIILHIPEFKNQGKFSKEKYQDFLRSNLHSDESFRQEIAKLVKLNHLQYGLIYSEFALDHDIEALMKLLSEQRQVYFTTIKKSIYKGKVNITDEAIKNYYDKNLDEYKTKEVVKLKYVKLNEKDIANTFKATDAELENYFNTHKHNYQAKAKYHLAHILLANNSDKQKVSETIKEIQQKLTAGESFAKIAKTYSEDLGTKNKGGDLGWVIAGEMVPEFEQAAFGLIQTGQVSDPVETEFGIHIIKLIELDKPVTVNFQKIKAQVLKDMRAEWAQTELLSKADELATISFESSHSLDPVKQQLNLEILQTSFISRTGGKTAFTKNPKVLAAAFSDDVFRDNNNSPLLEISKDEYVVLRVAEIKPARQQNLDEVKLAIKAKLIDEGSSQLAKTAAQSLQDDLEGKTLEQMENILAKQNLKWQKEWLHNGRNENKFDLQLLDATFTAAKTSFNKTNPGTTVIKLSNNDFAILGFVQLKTDPQPLHEDAKKSLRAQLAQNMGQEDFQRFNEYLYDQAEIERLDMTW